MLIPGDIHRIIIMEAGLERVGIDNENCEGKNREYEDISLHSLLMGGPVAEAPG